ncbi:hypothetical protein [Microbacterium sp. PF5]|uniref:hypothetical protein n=1 Tax=Microbacterium sp. PF5 TaxID=2305435 RepID=UPI00109BF191|nr:hypothetical protein [Microbacterium sp. PF5]
MQIPSVTPGAQPDGVETDWWAGWWDWSSFGPDALIGIGTGLIVAGIVSVAGRNAQSRTLSELVMGQQQRAVDAGNSLLRSGFSYPPGPMPELLPDTSNMDRLRDIVRSVPRGEPTKPVIGYEWVVGVVDAFDRLEVAADTVLGHVRRHGGASPTSEITEALLWRIWSLGNVNPKYAPYPMTTEPPLLEDWNEGGHLAAALDPIGGNLADDTPFRDEVNEYLRARRMLELYRNAFFQVQNTFRAELRGAPQKPRKRAFAAAFAKAQRHGRDVVTRAPESE